MVAARRFRPSIGRLTAITVFLSVLLASSPAFADEFEVGILVETTVSDESASSFLDGFRLAVDQSPDVSHPAGTEGGDHLGSMDVVLMVAGDTTDPDHLLSEARRMADRDSVAVIVVDVSSELLAEIHGPVTDSETVLIAMSDPGRTEFPVTPFFFVAAESDRFGHLMTDRVPAFEDAFFAAYGHEPSDEAVTGYLAGRLVDIAIGATDRDPSDVDAIAAALLASVVSPVDRLESVPPTDSTSTPNERTGIRRLGENAALTAVILGSLAIIGGIAVKTAAPWADRESVRR